MATTLSHESIRLSWTIEHERTDYRHDPGLRLRRRKSSSTVWHSLAASGLNGTRTDTGLEASTPYTYELTVQDGHGSSDTASATTGPPPDPLARPR